MLLAAALTLAATTPGEAAELAFSSRQPSLRVRRLVEVYSEYRVDTQRVDLCALPCTLSAENGPLWLEFSAPGRVSERRRLTPGVADTIQIDARLRSKTLAALGGSLVAVGAAAAITSLALEIDALVHPETAPSAEDFLVRDLVLRAAYYSGLGGGGAILLADLPHVRVTTEPAAVSVVLLGPVVGLRGAF